MTLQQKAERLYAAFSRAGSPKAAREGDLGICVNAIFSPEVLLSELRKAIAEIDAAEDQK